MNLVEAVQEGRNRQAQIDTQVATLQAQVVALQQERSAIAQDIAEIAAFLKTKGVTP